MDSGLHCSATRCLGVACGVTVGALFYIRPILEQLHPGGGASGWGGIFAGGPSSHRGTVMRFTRRDAPAERRSARAVHNVDRLLASSKTVTAPPDLIRSIPLPVSASRWRGRR